MRVLRVHLHRYEIRLSWTRLHIGQARNKSENTYRDYEMFGKLN